MRLTKVVVFCALAFAVGLNAPLRAAKARPGAACRVALYWFMDSVVLGGDDEMLPINEATARPYSHDVSVQIDFNYMNDDGSPGDFIGSTVEGSGADTVAYGDTGSQAAGLGDRVGYAASGIAGQELGYQLSARAADAARSAAAQANALSPAAQWGNWFADAASFGRNLAGRMIGAAGGIF